MPIVLSNLTLPEGLTFVGETYTAPPGQAQYTTPGTYSWTAPASVTSVSVVCIGGGGSGGSTGVNNGPGGGGGGGGGVAYKNNIAVTPSVSYTVVVGAGGTTLGTTSTRYSGGLSSFTNSVITVTAGGGQGGLRYPGSPS